MYQQDIIAEFGVQPYINVSEEIEKRVSFLADYLRFSGLKSFVLGISGGIDSTTAGRLAVLAVERLRSMAYDTPHEFIAVRLPYGKQFDQAEAEMALHFIKPHRTVISNIKAASDALIAEAVSVVETTPKDFDFILGNVKARQRMVTQYAIAGQRQGLVIGTDHAAEAIMGFFTKFGDGACDVTPLAGLNKRQVRQIAKALGCPDQLVNKVPTADLESLNPGLPDETSYGVTYNQIDDYLEGRWIDDQARMIIEKQYALTKHKRALPVSP